MKANKYKVIWTKKYKKSYDLCIKRGLDINLLDYIVFQLANGQILDPHHKDHKLQGKYTGYRECHIQPNWLLIYKIEDDKLILTLTNTGSHADLF